MKKYIYKYIFKYFLYTFLSKDASKLAVDADNSSSDDEGAPKISLAEMLENLFMFMI